MRSGNCCVAETYRYPLHSGQRKGGVQGKGHLERQGRIYGTRLRRSRALDVDGRRGLDQRFDDGEPSDGRA